MASKVDNWVACDLRYVGENKLARLHDAELVKLHHLLVKKHSLEFSPLSGNREQNISSILGLKKHIARSDTVAPTDAPAPAPAPEPAPAPGAQSMFEHTVATYAHEAISTAASLSASAPHDQPHEEHDAQGSQEEAPPPPRMMTVEEKLSEAAKAFDAMFAKEQEEEQGAKEGATGEPVVVGPTNPEQLSEEEKAAQKDREERVAAFVQLAAAAAPPAPKEGGDEEVKPAEAVTVDTHHRLRICSFNACKMRLGSANKAYADACDDGANGAYEGTHKGAELTQKWLTLAARMADFDVILLQEVPGTEKVMDQKIETFANMLDIATEEGREWSAINSQKSGKDGKVVGPGAEVHVCFLKSPVQFKSWNTLRKVGATELDYAPLQVHLHDERFADPADRDFVVTSVHLPPSKRVDARDSQIAALLRNYSAPDTSEYRMQHPFKPSKEAKTSPTHVIAGDFNTYPGNEQYNMLGSGFVSKIPKSAATTSGHQHYDNVLIDAHANDRLLIGGGIMQLKDLHNAAKGEVGLSDHHPVFVEVREVQKTGKQPKALPVVESEFVENVENVEPPPAPPPALGLHPVAEEEEEPSEETVKEVVSECMDRIMKNVMETHAEEGAPTPSAAPPPVALPTEEPPSAPRPAPAPAPGSPPTEPLVEVLTEEERAAWRATISQPLPELEPLPLQPTEAPPPPPPTSMTDSASSSQETTPPTTETTSPPSPEAD